jgi:threonine dehydrogenase-like Zn-dependent dehydrogenase
VELVERYRFAVREGFALVRVLHAGICNTDLELLRGYYAFRGTPGHEFVGVVEKADDKNLVGRRVGGEINLACGKCDWCARGAKVHHLGRHRNKLQISESAGASTEVVRGKLPVAEYEYVVDATGSAVGLTQAISMTRPRGTVIMKSTVHGAVPVRTAEAIVNEITLIGSRCGRFGPAIKLLAAGKVDVRPLISEVLPLSKARQAFATAARRGVMKVLLSPE